jgi:hypothetical protein
MESFLPQCTSLMAWRILKDGTRVALRWFCHLTVMCVLGKRFAQLLWLCVMQVDPQARDVGILLQRGSPIFITGGSFLVLIIGT